MDFSSICTFLLIVILFYFSYQYNFFLSSTNKKRAAPLLPPGKMGFPMIGETLEFLRNCKIGHPEYFIFNRMTKYSSKAFKTHILGEPTVVLCGPNGNKFLFSNENKVVRQWWPSSFDRIFEPDTKTNLAEEGKKLKKIPHILKPEILKLQIGTIDIVAQKHFSDAWEDKERVFVYPLATDFTLNLACRVFLSLDNPEQLRRLSKPFHCVASGLLSIPIDFPGTQFNRTLKAAKVLRSELCSIVRQRRLDLNEEKSSAMQDILSQMTVATSDEDRVKLFKDDYDIVNKIMGSIIAARGTTSIACTSVVKYLAELPHVYESAM